MNFTKYLFTAALADIALKEAQDLCDIELFLQEADQELTSIGKELDSIGAELEAATVNT